MLNFYIIDKILPHIYNFTHKYLIFLIYRYRLFHLYRIIDIITEY